ncbi:hypothetical protein PV325_000195, partial [Microctonus aethiopoides]
NTWNLTFPKSERDPEQFLMLLEDHLQTYGINKNLFVPCLSSIFTGGHRAWYILNKRNWRTWEDFSRAFRYQWSVKKSDGDLFLELNDLKFDKGETLAEFTCRARLIFERMRHPPTFKEQLKQILVKFNPRLTFELLNLPLHNYEEFLHYISERSYLFKRSVEFNKDTRLKTTRTDLKYLQDETDTADENYEQVEILELTDDDEKLTELNAIEQRSFRSNKMDSNKQSASKPLVRQRLENNLTNYKSRSNENNQTNSRNDQGQQNSRPQRDMSNFFCFNCGEKGHGARTCRADTQMVCFICRKIGHLNKDCRSWSGNDQSP